jgi:hypothetical protein
MQAEEPGTVRRRVTLFLAALVVAATVAAVVVARSTAPSSGEACFDGAPDDSVRSLLTRADLRADVHGVCLRTLTFSAGEVDHVDELVDELVELLEEDGWVTDGRSGAVVVATWGDGDGDRLRADLAPSRRSWVDERGERHDDVVVDVRMVALAAGEGELDRRGEPPALEQWPGTPRFVDGVVVVAGPGDVRGVDPVTEREVWRTDTCPVAEWASVAHDPSLEVAVLSCAGSYTGIAGRSGEVLWEERIPEPPDRVRITDRLLLTAFDQDVRVRDLRTGRLLWHDRDLGDSNVVGDDDRVFVSNDDGVHAFEGEDGDPLWFEPLPASGLFAADGFVYARANDQYVVCLDAATGAERWRSEVEESRLEWTDFLGVTDRVLVLLSRREGDQVSVYDRDTGELLWGHDALDEAELGVSTSDDTVVITDFASLTAVAYDDRTGEPVSQPALASVTPVAAAGDLSAHISLLTGDAQLRVTPLR